MLDLLSVVKSFDVHAHFLPAPYIEALQSSGMTTVDNRDFVPRWNADQAIEAMDEGGRLGRAMLSISSTFLHFVEQKQTIAPLDRAALEFALRSVVC